MSVLGNLMTHYRYERSRIAIQCCGDKLLWTVRTADAGADLEVEADLGSKPAPLPESSPFATLAEARKFAGPLPYTFSYERSSNSIISVRGVRKAWNPQPITVEVGECTFFKRPPFRDESPVLANAFHLEGVSYEWERGVRHPLPRRQVAD